MQQKCIVIMAMMMSGLFLSTLRVVDCISILRSIAVVDEGNEVPTTDVQSIVSVTLVRKKFKTSSDDVESLLTLATKESAATILDGVCLGYENLQQFIPSSSESYYSSAYHCEDVVDYDFFLPSSMNLTSMNNVASGYLSVPGYAILPNKCQTALKKSICASIYQKCPSGFRLNDTSTWSTRSILVGSFSSATPSKNTSTTNTSSSGPVSNSSSLRQEYHYVNVSLPYELTCTSVCDEMNAQCFGFLKLFDYAVDGLDALVNCSSRRNISDEYSNALLLSTSSLSSSLFAASSMSATNYSDAQYYIAEYPLTYDSSNNPALCNSVPADAVVAAATETYLHANANKISQVACAGIFGEDDRVYIPAAGASLVPGSLSLGVPPFSRPYEYQNASELAIKAVLLTLPFWLSGQCFASVRRLLCSSLFLSPQTLVLRDGILDAATSQGIEKADAESFLEQLFRDYSTTSATSSTSTSTSPSNSPLSANYTLTLPSLPDRSLCLNFHSTCGGDMSSLWWESEQYPLLWRLVTRQCDALVQVDPTATAGSSSGLEVSLYPVGGERHAVLRLQARIASLLSAASVSSTISSSSSSKDTISFDLFTNGSTASLQSKSSSEFNGAGDAISLSQWQTQCPHGFVVPEGDPTHPGIEWMPGTGCATNCR
jgi:hypothetical protein